MKEAIEHNNRERVKAFGNAPAGEMSIRTKIAVDIVAAMVGKSSYALMEEDLDAAIAIADRLIKRLCENG